MLTELSIIKTGKNSAIYSFAFGTLLLLSYLVTKAESLLLFGLAYVYVAVFVNLAILISLVFAVIAYRENRNTTWLTIFYVLLNIPIDFAYYFIVLTIG